ncbi:DUF397 domain-containing protein [Streptomyces sp. NPDC001492]
MFDNELVWRKSSFCGNESECVEVLQQGESVMVRDSKILRGSLLNLHGKTWRDFVEFVANGDK